MTQPCQFYLKNKCSFGDTCRFFHPKVETKVETKAEIRAETKAEIKAEIRVKIKKNKSKSRCLELQYSFTVATCSNWGSGCECGCDDNDDNDDNDGYDSDKVKHRRETFECTDYIWIDNNPEFIYETLEEYKDMLEKTNKFYKLFNYVGPGNDGQIVVNGMKMVNLTNVRYNPLEYLTANGEWVSVHSRINLVDDFYPG
jgi:hypothetical protein